MVFGSLLALMKLGKNKFFKGALAIIYIEYVRGTPLLVQIFIVYFEQEYWDWIYRNW